MNDVLYELGLEYVDDISDYDTLRLQIYEYYGYRASGILGGITHTPNGDFNFPEPLEFCKEITLPPVHIAATSPAAEKEQFFKNLLRPEARALLPFVDAILTAEHKNSPLFTASANLAIDRESIAQIVDRAYRLAGKAGVTSSPHTKALLNMLVLTELLIWQ